MDRITTLVRDVLIGYTGEALNGHSYLAHSDDDSLFTVWSVGVMDGERFTDTGLVVRVINDLIIIEQDANDKMLVDALVEAGIPRDQIILAYAGEPVPEFAFAS